MEHNKVDTKLQESSYDDQQKWVLDSSLDSRGGVPVRARTGAWRAALFVIANEFSERLSYFGIVTSLVVYLTTILHQDLKMAVRNANYWSGVTTLMPLLGGFVADAYLGRYATVLLATIIYLMGLILLTLSWFIPGLKAFNQEICVEPRKAHEIAFFIAIYLISIGTGGHKPSLESFGADQFEDGHPEERKMKMSYFNWWSTGLCAGVLTAVTVIVYIEDRIGWGVAGIILTVVMATSLLIFLMGRPFYRYRAPTGSPLTPMLQVFVAAISKRHLPCPNDSSLLHELSREEYTKGRFLSSTNNLKFLDKAAIIENRGSENGMAEKKSPWKLATVTKVEELKLLINMIPIWFFTLAFGICATQGTTFFIKQAIIMDRHIGHNFIVPPSSMFALVALSMIIFLTFYEKLLVPILRRVTGNERGISILKRIGTGMVFSLITMIIAALIERKRLDYTKQHHMAMSVIWLAPQFIVIGIADALTLVGLQEYFYDQVPDSMRSLGIAFYLSVIGAASFVNNFLITVTDRLAEEISGKSLFGKDLNSSRLDRFYWTLAALTAPKSTLIRVCNQVWLLLTVAMTSRQPRWAIRQTRVGVVVEGGQRALHTATAVNNTVVDAGNRKLLQQQQSNKPSLNQKQGGSISHLVAGGISGAFAKTCTAPLARLTILFQIQGMQSETAILSSPSIWREASRIVNEEGFRAFWKGNLVTVAHRLPYSAVNFYAYEEYNTLFYSNPVLKRFKGNASLDVLVHFVSGGLAGMTAASATYPLDLVRTRLSAQRSSMYYQGVGHAFRTIIREEGFWGLYKGLGATLLGVGPSLAISFSAYNSLKTSWLSHRPNDSEVMVSLSCGSLSGIASSTATFPVDLVRRRMQLEGAGGRARVYKTGLLGTFKHIFKAEGMRGLYRGILPEYYKVAPGVGIAFMAYEKLKKLLSSAPN
ncbi:hypothetical protein HID58_014336 [Brassica napus]|uniref:Uncharacterized protein n=1 Tax=Brassica napus TaxID=3708 RepID=A0ABQ8DGZ4_BRANA|nr:hypothetical protein HID58_014336 [Brassica napus]